MINWVWGFVMATALVGLTCEPARAGQYKLVTGHGVEVCEAYAKNLASVAPDPVTGARMCPIPLAKELTDFHEPTWNGRYKEPSMPVPVGVDLTMKIDSYIWKRGVNPAAYVPMSEWRNWSGTPQQIEQAWQSFRRTRESLYSVPPNQDAYTVMDVDNDGTLEPVYNDNRTCPYGGFGSLLLVLRDDYSDVDLIKTNRVMVNPPRAKDTPAFRSLKTGDFNFSVDAKALNFTLTEDAMRASHYDVFQYRGKNYLNFWGFEQSDSPDVNAPIHVYLVEKDRKRKLCTYRFFP